jgi:uncharacterized membrane protein
MVTSIATGSYGNDKTIALLEHVYNFILTSRLWKKAKHSRADTACFFRLFSNKAPVAARNPQLPREIGFKF